MKYKTEHPQKHISYGHVEADVDEEIADLILDCWKCGIRTTLSCQNNVPKNWIWIAFHDCSDVEKFLNIAASVYDEDCKSFYGRVFQRLGVTKNSWKFSVNVHDFSVNYLLDEEKNEISEEVISSKRDFRFEPSIRFPAKDLPLVKKRLMKAAVGGEVK